MKKLLVVLFSFFFVAGPAFAERLVTLTGTVTYAEDVVLPAGSKLSVNVLNETTSESLVSESYDITTPKPFAFSLIYDRSRVAPEATFIVDAKIISSQDRLLFATKERVLVNLSQTPDEAVHVTVVKVGD